MDIFEKFFHIWNLWGSMHLSINVWSWSGKNSKSWYSLVNSDSREKIDDQLNTETVDYEYIAEDQYSILVGLGGVTIDMIRDQTKANITIKEKSDEPPNKYYEVLYSGTGDQVKFAKRSVTKVLGTKRYRS